MDFKQLAYQKKIATKGAEILKEHGMVYLSMEMRTGKTITAFYMCKNRKFKNVFMVSAKKALSSLSKDAQLFEDDFKFMCTNYEQLHNFDEFGFKPDVIIVDEAHNLGQFPKPSERTKNLKKICEGLPIIYLSGTPTPESYSQIYHQFYISSYSPFSEYKSFYKWAVDYVIVTTRYLGQIQVKDYSSGIESKIKEKIDHLFLSYTQEEAGFNQVVEEKVITVPTGEGTKYLAKRLLLDRVFYGNDGSTIVAETEVKLQGKIHQICSGTVILDDDTAKVFDKSKADYIRENYKGKKIAIYYKYTAEYAAILETFGFDRLTDNPEFFNSTDDNIIFCSQVQSGREGVNLSSADYILMYNIDYSATCYFQIRQRMQIKNRDRPAVIHWLFSDIGMEQKIYLSVQSKKDYTLSYFKKDFDVKTKSKTR